MNESNFSYKKRSVWKKFSQPVETVRKLLRTGSLCAKTVPVASTKFPKTLYHAIRLCYREGYTPQEAYRLGLFDPNMPPEERSRCVSKHKLRQIQSRLNPESWSVLTEDKGCFYRYCQALKIPVPELYALFFKNGAGWVCNDTAFQGISDWICFFERQLPNNFVIKPVNGVYGAGVSVLQRQGDQFVAFPGKNIFSASELLDTMYSNEEFTSFIIQERLNNHPAIEHLSGSKFLQTIRINTFVDLTGQCRISYANFKIIVGENVVDNYERGQTGNLLAKVLLNKGQLQSAFLMTDTRQSTIFTRHPETGVSISGFTFPFWAECKQLVERAASAFIPLRHIGWDVAITPNGPVMLEGNAYGDPSELRNMGRTMEMLCHEFKAC